MLPAFLQLTGPLNNLLLKRRIEMREVPFCPLAIGDVRHDTADAIDRIFRIPKGEFNHDAGVFPIGILCNFLKFNEHPGFHHLLIMGLEHDGLTRRKNLPVGFSQNLSGMYAESLFERVVHQEVSPFGVFQKHHRGAVLQDLRELAFGHSQRRLCLFALRDVLHDGDVERRLFARTPHW